MSFFCFSLIPTFHLLTFFRRGWHFKEPFQSSASWLHPFGYPTKITFLQTFYWICHKSRTSEHNIFCGRQEKSKQVFQCLTCMCIIPKHLDLRIEFVCCEKSHCGWAEGQTAWLISAHTEVRIAQGSLSLLPPSSAPVSECSSPSPELPSPITARGNGEEPWRRGSSVNSDSPCQRRAAETLLGQLPMQNASQDVVLVVFHSRIMGFKGICLLLLVLNKKDQYKW